MTKRKAEDDIVNVLVKKHKDAEKEWKLSVEEAKKVDKLNDKLRKDFTKYHEEQMIEKAKFIRENPVIDYNAKPKDFIKVPPLPVVKPLSVKEIKRLDDLDKKLKREAVTYQLRELEEKREKEKQFEPIVNVIKEQTEEVKPKTKKRVHIQSRQSAEQFRPRAYSTPGKSKVDLPVTQPLPEEEDDANVFENTTLAADQEDILQNRSIREFVEDNIIGDIAKQYLASGSDRVFGVRFDFVKNKLAIGSQTITIEGDDIILNDSMQRYIGTEGLWVLLTKAEIHGVTSYQAVGATARERLISIGAITAEDFKNYKDIIIKTNAMYKNNDPATRRPKSNRGWKWNQLISEIWKEMKQSTGSGLKFVTETPVEYKYINKLKDLIDRLLYIQAQEQAGNNSFHNEKMSVVKFIYDRMEELISKPNGIKYIVRCLSLLPEKDIAGCGLLNDIINKLPFELHAPGMNFLGPGTKLQKRLARGDRGVNPLDEAAREHDIWYSKHKRAEDRWEADKVLQDKAFERVISPDASNYERLLSLGTGTAMWAKRKLGMGVSATASGCIYPRV